MGGIGAENEVAPTITAGMSSLEPTIAIIREKGMEIKKLTEENQSNDEENARAELIRIAEDNDWFYVTWWGQTGYSFWIYKRNDITRKTRRNEVYGAMYEQFYDVIKDTDDSDEIAQLWLPDGDEGINATWKGVLDEVKERLPDCC